MCPDYCEVITFNLPIHRKFTMIGMLLIYLQTHINNGPSLREFSPQYIGVIS